LRTPPLVLRRLSDREYHVDLPPDEADGGPKETAFRLDAAASQRCLRITGNDVNVFYTVRGELVPVVCPVAEYLQTGRPLRWSSDSPSSQSFRDAAPRDEREFTV
jgi:hypothetical protein